MTPREAVPLIGVSNAVIGHADIFDEPTLGEHFPQVDADVLETLGEWLPELGDEGEKALVRRLAARRPFESEQEVIGKFVSKRHRRDVSRARGEDSWHDGLALVDGADLMSIPVGDTDTVGRLPVLKGPFGFALGLLQAGYCPTNPVARASVPPGDIWPAHMESPRAHKGALTPQGARVVIANPVSAGVGGVLGAAAPPPVRASATRALTVPGPQAGGTGRAEPVVLSADAWSKRQVAEFIARAFAQGMEPLDSEQQARYLALERQMRASHQQLGDAMSDQFAQMESGQQRAFEARLETAFGRKFDSNRTYIHARVLLAEPRRKVDDMLGDLLDGKSDGSDYGVDPFRGKGTIGQRALETYQSQTLWEAAKTNYAYNRGAERWSDSSFLSSSDNPLAGGFSQRGDVDRFIALTRDFDLGKRMRGELAAWFAGIRVDRDIRHALRDAFSFDLIEALRDGERSGIDADRERRWRTAFDAGSIRATPLHVRINGMFREAMPLPAFLLTAPGLDGICVYFPQRPGGALQCYPDTTAAHRAMREQFVDGSVDSDVWLARQLPIGQRTGFLDAQKINVKPAGLSWLANHLYKLFNPNRGVRPKNFEVGTATASRDFSVLQGVVFRHRWSDATLASTVTAGMQDYAAFERSFSEVVNEILQWTMVGGAAGAPGKVLCAIFAGLAIKDVVAGVNDAAITDGSALAEALETILTLGVTEGASAGLRHLSTAHVESLVASAGYPVHATKPDGGIELFRPDWDAYAPSSGLPDATAWPGHDGLFAVDEKRYARVESAGVLRWVEVEPVAASPGGRYRVVTADTALREMHVVYDRVLERWTPSFEDVTRLDDVVVMERMLSRLEASAEDARQVLDVTDIDPAQLRAIWNDVTVVPAGLVEAVGRIRAHAELVDLLAALSGRDRSAPPVADEVLGRLLAGTVGREVRIHEANRLTERTAPPGASGRPIELVKLGVNHFIPREGTVPNEAVPGPFSMVDALVDADPTVGIDAASRVQYGSAASDAGTRRRVLMDALADRLRSHPQSLYDYLLMRRGLVLRDAAWRANEFVADAFPDPAANALRRKHPELPDAVARHMAGNPAFRRMMDERGRTVDPDIGLLVARHAVHSRVQRARESLWFGRSGVDGEVLALSLWTRLPEWPWGVRVDVLQGLAGYGGEIIRGQSVLGFHGPVDATTVVRLLRTEDGRYAAVGGEGDTEGEVVGEYPGDQLASALLAAMTDRQRRRLGIDITDADALRQRGRDMAAVHDTDTLHTLLDQEKTAFRCKRAPGDTCSGTATLPTDDSWLPPERELTNFRDRLHSFGVRSLVLPQNMVKDFLIAMHLHHPAEFGLFSSVMEAILSRGTAYRGLPDYMVMRLGALERRNFANQVDNEPLNQALAAHAFTLVRTSYKESSLRSSNKRYDESVAGPYKAWQTDARVWGASYEVAQMRAVVPHAGPGGTWSSTSWSNMQRVKKVGVGNCAELAAAAADIISLKGYRAEVWQLMEGDHAFVVVGEPPALSVAGENHVPAGGRHGFAGGPWKALWVVDPWLGIHCPAVEYATKAILKLMLWESKGKQILVRNPNYSHIDPRPVIWQKPDAAYRIAFSGNLARNVQGGLISLVRQRWYDVLRQAGVPDTSSPGYVPRADQPMTRQSLSVEQNADLLRASSNDMALEGGPSPETIDRFVNQYMTDHQGDLPEIGDVNRELNRLETEMEVDPVDVRQDEPWAYDPADWNWLPEIMDQQQNPPVP
ncbi:MAG TPA: hypothetical protein VGO76_15670 [Luteibacter sp.]|nr:hypothetical protein [Luteibacter sp.]